MNPTENFPLSIFLISLERSVQRREATLEQLGELRDQVRWIKGVDGYRLTPEEAGKCSKWRAFLKYDRPMFPGEFGCALAHLNAVEAFVETGQEECLILEDDIDIHPAFHELIRSRRRGAAAARNAGLQEASGDYIQYLDAMMCSHLRRCRG